MSATAIYIGVPLVVHGEFIPIIITWKRQYLTSLTNLHRGFDQSWKMVRCPYAQTSSGALGHELQL
jgi:hypothetical protein